MVSRNLKVEGTWLNRNTEICYDYFKAKRKNTDQKDDYIEEAPRIHPLLFTEP